MSKALSAAGINNFGWYWGGVYSKEEFIATRKM
jgi:hypothetical protein